MDVNDTFVRDMPNRQLNQTIKEPLHRRAKWGQTKKLKVKSQTNFPVAHMYYNATGNEKACYRALARHCLY